MSDQGLEIRFGGEETNFLAILLRGRAYRQSKDYWDGNWLLVTVTVHAGKFVGVVPGMIRAEELVLFAERLKTLNESLAGEVEFQTMEQWLEFRISGDGLGHIRLTGSIQDDPGSPNQLSFALSTDQTYLREILKQLERTTKAYPVVGKPE